MTYDAVIVGGGMIGSAVALGLAKQGRSVALVEKRLPATFDSYQPPDVRLSALSLHSVQLLKKLGAWQHIELMRSQPYTELAVWENATTEQQKTVFKASSIDVETLGHFVENRLTQLALHQELKCFSNVEWFSKSTILSIKSNKNSLEECNLIELEDGTTISGHWLIGADGAQSKVRDWLGIGQTGWQYKQQAMGIIIELDQPSGSRTWQQFKPTGPVAFLPMYDHYAALIWYHSANDIAQLVSSSEEVLESKIKQNFPPLDANFNIIQRASFPLTRAHANQYVMHQAVLVGDAAHTINPLAGQGVNIGFKDVEALLALFEQNQRPTSEQMIAQYEKIRRRQNLLMMTAMDAFYLAFSNEIGPLKWLRNTALNLAENAGKIKQQALKYALGL